MKNVCKKIINKKVLMLVFVAIIFGSEMASAENPPEIEWNISFGGTANEVAYSVQQTTDGGYILAGTTRSFGAGGEDAWLVKTDSKGNKEWDKTFGGTKYDMAYSVQQTSDGGYIFAGDTISYSDSYDFWLVKTDSNGNKQWNKIFGGSGWEKAHSVQQTTDGGYIIAGQKGLHAEADVWLVKTDSSGNKQWDKTFGGDATDIAQSVQQTPDGGYIIAGLTKSFTAMDDDFWLIKLDSRGNKEWDRVFVKRGAQGATSIVCTIDGGYIVAGFSSHGTPSNIWILKTDSGGNRLWDRTFNGWSGYNKANSIQQTTDGGYIIAGITAIPGDGFISFLNPLIIKTNSNGVEQWNMTFEFKVNGNYAHSVQQTIDNGYIIAGRVGHLDGGERRENMLLMKIKGQEIVSPPSDEDDDSYGQKDTNFLLFQKDDFKNFPSFAIKLKYSQDPISMCLREHLSAGTLQLLQGYNDQGQPPEELQTALETELNEILQSGSLYDQQRFDDIKLSNEVLKLIEDNPQDQDLIELNRRLLEEAYPQEIEKYKIKTSEHIPGFMGFILIISILFIWGTRKFA